MEEMLDDAMNVEEDEEVEEEADEEVDKVLFELTNGKLGQAGTVDTQLPVSTLLLGDRLSMETFCVGCSGRRGTGREGDGTLQGTTQRSTQRVGYGLITVLLSGIRWRASNQDYFRSLADAYLCEEKACNILLFCMLFPW